MAFINSWNQQNPHPRDMAFLAIAMNGGSDLSRATRLRNATHHIYFQLKRLAHDNDRSKCFRLDIKLSERVIGRFQLSCNSFIADLNVLFL